MGGRVWFINQEVEEARLEIAMSGMSEDGEKLYLALAVIYAGGRWDAIFQDGLDAGCASLTAVFGEFGFPEPEIAAAIQNFRDRSFNFCYDRKLDMAAFRREIQRAWNELHAKSQANGTEGAPDHAAGKEL